MMEIQKYISKFKSSLTYNFLRPLGRKFFLLMLLTLAFSLLISPKTISAQTYDKYIYQYFSPQNIQGADDLKTKLEEEVNKIIKAGHLIPFRALYGETVLSYFWYHRYDTVYTLSLAYPYLSSSTQAAVKTYIQSEMTTYPLWSATLLDTLVGTKRQPDELTQAEFNTPAIYISNLYTSRPKLFALYALWLYAQNTGDWQYIESNWANIKTFYNNTKAAETGKFYTSISGSIGMARLAEQKPTKDVATRDQAITDVNTGLTSGKDLNQFGVNATNAFNFNTWIFSSGPIKSIYQGFHFLDITPEIGRYFSEDPALKADVLGSTAADIYSLKRGTSFFPLWYMAQAPVWTTYYGEGSGNPVDTKAMIFPLKAWVVKEPADQLRKYLDVPDALLGDYYYMQNLTRTIEASGAECWEDVLTTTQECTSLVTPTPTPTPAPTPCTLTGASWDAPSSVVSGTPVTLTVNGSNCDGQTVNFLVRENDSILEGGIDEDASSQPSPNSTVFSSNTATISWTATYMQDGLGGVFDPPEYYFNAIVGTSILRSADPLLIVTQVVTPTPTPTPGSISGTDWPQVQRDANHSGYVPQTVGPPYTELWRVYKRFPVSTRVQPIIAQNLVFLPSNDKSLYALRTSDGATEWSYPTGGALVNSAAYDPSTGSGLVFFGSTDHSVYALNANDGSLSWKYKTGNTVKTAPVVAGGKVFVGSSDGKMYALDENTGSKLWEYDIGAPIYDTAAYDNGKVFFGGMNSVGYALDANTGAKIWEIPIPGQGFRDRWTVAGNGKVFFTPVLYGNYHDQLYAGAQMFGVNANPTLYDKPWSDQKTAILNYFANNPYAQPMFVVDQNTGQESFTPPVMYGTGGSQSPHSQVVLLPNGNANVIYRRSFGQPTSGGLNGGGNDLFTGELVLSGTNVGDILEIDTCPVGATGGIANCGNYKSPFIADESSTLARSGEIIYLDIARGTAGLDIRNQKLVGPIVCYNTNMLGLCDGAVGPIYFNDYYLPGVGGWRQDPNNLFSETDSDGNNIKRPTPIVDDTFYIFHYSTLVKVKGTKR